jgi:predicted enzyme related to lactoylglutathione lyase
VPEISDFSPGSFCWIDSGTDDLAKARTFYNSVFGWDYTVADETGYLMCRKEARPVAGLYALNQAMLRMGAVPCWLAYAAVPDADAALAAVRRAGGRPIGPAFDVPGLGRGGAFFDPAGAMCGVWQGAGHRGAGLIDEHGTLTWMELQVADPQSVGDFYCSVFGWALEKVVMPDGAYYLFKDGEASRAGMMAITPAMAEVPPNWSVYFHVDDADATVAATVAAGGSLVVPAMPIGSWGRMAVLRSADGAYFSILQAAPMV